MYSCGRIKATYPLQAHLKHCTSLLKQEGSEFVSGLHYQQSARGKQITAKSNSRIITAVINHTASLVTANSESFTFIQGGIVMLRLQSTCWLSSYLVDLRRKDKNPVGSLVLSLTLDSQTNSYKSCRTSADVRVDNNGHKTIMLTP